MIREQPIPFYHLYGEDFIRLEPGFVHLENIASRSSSLGWEIKPHRHNKLTQIVCVFDNHWEVELDEERHNLDGNWLVLIPPGTVHGFHFSEGTQGFVLSVNSDFLSSAIQNDGISSLSSLISQKLALKVKTVSQLERLKTLVALLKDELAVNDMSSQHAVSLLLKLVFVVVYRQQKMDAIQQASARRGSKTLIGFRELVEKHYTEHLSVADYAERLFVSASTLNRVCQHLLNTSPKTLIHQRLISEAKRRLIYTQQTVDEISLTLGFKDPGYFSRFFKQMEGVTAGTFRKNSLVS